MNNRELTQEDIQQLESWRLGNNIKADYMLEKYGFQSPDEESEESFGLWLQEVCGQDYIQTMVDGCIEQLKINRIQMYSDYLVEQPEMNLNDWDVDKI